MEVSLSEAQVREVIRCARDPIYFVETYAWLERKETTEILPFNPYPYQFEMLKALRDHQNLLILKSRRVGCSWTAAAYTAWLLNFRKGVNVLFLSKKQADAKKLLAKVKFILKNLALHDSNIYERATKTSWLCGEINTDNQEMLTIAYRDDNGNIVAESECASLTTTSESGRSEGATLIYLDEFAFVKPDDEATWAAIKPTVTRGGQWVTTSSPRGAGGVFHRLCMESQRGENRSYKYREVHWSEAGITQEEYERTIEGMDQASILQEWELQFIQSGNPVFNATDLAACYKPLDEYPEVGQEIQRYREQVGNYYSGVDSAVGHAHRKSKLKDYNCWTSLTKSGIQAFTVYNKEPLSRWAGSTEVVSGGTLYDVAGQTSELHTHYPGPLKVEDNGPGATVINRHQVPQDGESDLIPLHSDAPTKSRLIRNLMIAIESHSLTITDRFTYQCLMAYQHGNTPGQYEAPPGQNDDPVIALALAYDLMIEYGNMEFSWGDGQPARRVLAPQEISRIDMDNAPQGPEIIPIDTLRASEFLPGIGQYSLNLDTLMMPDMCPYGDEFMREPGSMRKHGHLR